MLKRVFEQAFEAPSQDPDFEYAIDFDALVADKAVDNNALRALLNERGAFAVIPARAGRKTPVRHDREMHRWRHPVESFFQRLEEFGRIAT